MPNEDQGIGGNGKRSLRRPNLSTRKFSAWKKKKIYIKIFIIVINNNLSHCF
jgi:hypothetical protein